MPTQISTPSVDRTLRGAILALAGVLLLVGLARPFAASSHHDATPATAATPEAVRTMTIDDVVAALRAAGLDAERTGQTVQQPFLALPGEIVLVEGQSLQVYVYSSAEARAADADEVAPDGTFSSPTMMITWVAEPHFALAANVLTLLVSDDDALAAAIAAALTAPPAATPTAGTPATTPTGGTPDASPAASASRSAEDVVTALRAAGLRVESNGETIREPFFSVPADLLTVNGTPAQVWVYPDEAARATDAAKIGPDGSTIGNAIVDWIATPHFTSAGNLLVLVVTDDAALAARVAEAVATLA